MGETVSNMIAGIDTQPGPVAKGKVLVYHKGSVTHVYSVSDKDSEFQTAIDDADETEFDSILDGYTWASSYTAAERAAWYRSALKAWAC